MAATVDVPAKGASHGSLHGRGPHTGRYAREHKLADIRGAAHRADAATNRVDSAICADCN
jgi:hypothetical protein